MYTLHVRLLLYNTFVKKGMLFEVKYNNKHHLLLRVGIETNSLKVSVYRVSVVRFQIENLVLMPQH